MQTFIYLEGADSFTLSLPDAETEIVSGVCAGEIPALCSHPLTGTHNM